LLAEVKLACHPGTPSDAVRGVTARLERAGGEDLRITYLLEGDLARLRIPALARPRTGEKLWQHTCFEIFIARRMPSYHELNFSPSREWAAYAFSEYRDGAPRADNSLDPQIAVRTRADGLDLEATVRLHRLSPPLVAGKLSIGLSAVIEDVEGGLSYWALRHPPGKPDFHHPEAFALVLDEARN
jgi:hypothetical protein